MRLTSIALCLVLLLIGSIFSPVKADDTTQLPKVPDQSTVLFVNKEHKVTQGKAWLTRTTMGHHSYHMHGSSSIRLELQSMQLKPGNYHLGLIARTGTHWKQPSNHLNEYQLTLITADNRSIDLGKLQLLNSQQYPLIRESGKENAYANWFGSIVLPNVCHLTGKEILEVTNVNNHGGVVAVWVNPNDLGRPTQIQIKTNTRNNAYILGQKPTLSIELTPSAGAKDRE